MKDTRNQTRSLAPPGAGLPTAQRLFARWIVGPILSKALPLRSAREHYEAHTATLISSVSSASKDERWIPVLIPPMGGLEDSSRHWSLQGVLEHVLTVSRGIEGVICSLGQGIAPPGAADPAKVKPKNPGQDHLEEFVRFAPGLLDRIDRRVLSGEIDLNSEVTFFHPWFGHLNARQWYWFISRHQAIHARQALAISARGFGKGTTI